MRTEFEPDSSVLSFEEIDRTQVAIVGGKGAHLGELSRIDGIRVPAGFCVTTDAFRRIIAEAPSIDDRLDRLSRLSPDDREAIRTLSAEIRRTLEGTAIPDDVAAAISRAVTRLGAQAAYAVRSSATAEDLPTASFAGQQDTYLNIVGPAAILQHVSRCWASLFTERAVTYRLRNGFDHRKVHMAVVVQQMVFPEAAGVLFTADPVTSNRKVASVEANFGLGEALVSGLVNADVYKVRDGEIVDKTVATKELAISASAGGGTQEQAIEPARQQQPALTDTQVLRLARLGQRIEAHFGCPQDVEWCLVDDAFQIVQSRAITTLFPIPEVGDQGNHVYVSVGHQQMMTDPMKPLGLSLWLLTTPAPMYEAGGRLFVDVTARLASRSSRAGFLEMVAKSDPLIRDALQTILDRGDFVPSLPDEGGGGPPAGGAPTPIEADPAIVDELIGHNQASVADLKRAIQTKSGAALFDFILADLQELRRILFDPQSHQVFMSAMEATWWLNEQSGGVAGREERGRHSHAVRSQQRHVGDGNGAARRRRRHPPTPGCRGLSRTRRPRRLPGRAGRDRGRARRATTPSGTTSTGTACAASARSTSRDRVGANTPPRSCPSSSATSRTSNPAPRIGASSKDGRKRRRRNRNCSSACGPCRTESRKPKRPSARSISSGRSSGTGSIRSTA